MRIECNILQKCNARCDHCNKAVGYADATTSSTNTPLLPMMTVEQIRRAIDQILEQDIPVGRFTICGGEPIMHPQLQEILDEVARLVNRPRGLYLKVGRVLTNDMNRTAEARAKIRMPHRFLWVPNALDDPDDPMSGKNDRSKRGNRRAHSPFWISPADVGMESRFEDCTVKGWCGKGLDSSGWSMCGKAVMLGKLFGVDPTMREGDIQKHVMTPINDLCKHCQYGLGGKKKRVKSGFPRVNLKAQEIEDRFRNGELPEVSKSFREAFDNYNANGPLVELEEM